MCIVSKYDIPCERLSETGKIFKNHAISSHNDIHYQNIPKMMKTIYYY